MDRSLRQSLASETWRDEATAKVIEFCRRLAGMPEGDCLVGLHLGGGVYGEWHYWGFPHQPDTGPAMTARFRRWLREKYGDDATLQAAWNDPGVTLATAVVPGLAPRQHTAAGVFRDPAKERSVIDYYQCQHDVVADDVIHFCRTAKENWPRPLITGLFYGYFLHEPGAMPQTGGHLEEQRILNSPYVDYLSGPLSYELDVRRLGGTGQSRGLLESCRLHGKLWLDEMDQPTALGDAFGRDPPFRQTTIEDSIAVMRRNAVCPLSRGMGLWWYDFGPKGHGGWWDDPQLMAEVGRLKSLFDRYSLKPYRPEADVLMVFDTRTFYFLGGQDQTDAISFAVINSLSADACHSGVMFDTIYLSDLERVDWSRYRAVVFANTFVLTAAQRQYITQHVARGGRHLIWLYAPGYSDGQRLSTDFVSQAIGIAVERTSLASPPKVEVRTSRLPAIEFQIDRPVRPLLAVKDEAATPLGRYAGTSQVAFARKKLADSTAWFCGLPLRNPGLMCEIFRRAGAHVYDEKDNVVYSGSGILCVHTETGGRRSLSLRNGKHIEAELPPRSTSVYDGATGELLLGNNP